MGADKSVESTERQPKDGRSHESWWRRSGDILIEIAGWAVIVVTVLAASFIILRYIRGHMSCGGTSGRIRVDYTLRGFLIQGVLIPWCLFAAAARYGWKLRYGRIKNAFKLLGVSVLLAIVSGFVVFADWGAMPPPGYVMTWAGVLFGVTVAVYLPVSLLSVLLCLGLFVFELFE